MRQEEILAEHIYARGDGMYRRVLFIKLNPNFRSGFAVTFQWWKPNSRYQIVKEGVTDLGMFAENSVAKVGIYAT